MDKAGMSDMHGSKSSGGYSAPTSIDPPLVAGLPIALPAKELPSIDFEAMIGGPLVATIHAQVQSAVATVNFVKTMGFEQNTMGMMSNGISSSTGQPHYVTFEYTKTGRDGVLRPSKLQVPFLTMLPIPSLRIEEVTIDFLAKVNSVAARALDTSVGLGMEAAGHYDFFLIGAGMKVSSVQQRQTKEGNVVTRDYSVNIRVKAKHDELPAGLDRLMSILESAIKDVPEAGIKDASIAI